MPDTPHVPLDDAHLTQYAANVARQLPVSGTLSAARTARQLRRDLKRLEELLQQETGPSDPSLRALLSDNWHLIKRMGAEARRCFRESRPLRRTDRGTALLLECARSGLWAVPTLDAEQLERYLAGFQTVVTLTEQELSQLVPALTAVLLERLALVCAAGEVDLRRGKEVVAALHALSGTNWGPILEEASVVEQILRRDPSGHYGRMEERTRRDYRRQVCRLAKQYGMPEENIAEQALSLARQGKELHGHVGWYLFVQPLGQDEPTPSGRGYVAALTGISLFLSAAVAVASQSFLTGILLFLPLSEVVKCGLDCALLRLLPPRPVPRMALEDGIPAEGRTLCVVVALLTGADSGEKLCRRLAQYRLTNQDAGEELHFGILADLPDSAAPMGEQEQAWVEAAKQAVERLNETWGHGFYLFFRAPVYSQPEKRYSGWERKRGALLELTRLLRGKETSLHILSGDPAALKGTRYVITLDTDTHLNVGAAREMVGAMLHPLNQPILDEERKIVVSGHALLQPRVCVALEDANRSLFARVMSGGGGADFYGAAVSDLYHDRFDQGTYVGKGIFQVDSYSRCLDGRFPERRILSHDLLEGSILRAGFLNDVELSDGCPGKATGYFARLNRWTRGDWQLLPWLFAKTPQKDGETEENPLSFLARWKLLDNLRRSLVPPFALAAAVCGLCGLGGVPWWIGWLALLVVGLRGTLRQGVLRLLFLPVYAYTTVTAVCAALWRTYVSKRGQLAWVTAAQGEQGGSEFSRCVRRFWFSVVEGLMILICAQTPLGKLVGLGWLFVPALAFWMSRPPKKHAELGREDRAFLRRQAGLIWNYFSQQLCPENHYLPPDHWQEEPPMGAAERTSPTNIGLALLSVMAAADLSLLTKRQAVERIEKMLDTTQQLEKWRGIPLNWYDNATLCPLKPRFVSTVDAGNLCACLIVLEVGMEQWGEDKLARRILEIWKGINLVSLYDARRNLFYVGYDLDAERPTKAHYDLFSSEASLTSYLAVASGQIPPRHWRALDRRPIGHGGGMASWSGSIFETFMPQLFLPCPDHSALQESLSHCLLAQRRKAAQIGTPWGFSESCFYALGPDGSYQYQAHGVQALALKRGMDNEQVISPYSSFLVLQFAPQEAVKNLRRLQKRGMEGQYGLYEALDLTPSRIPAGSTQAVVRTYMAHHLGMSLVAIDNALNHDLMRRRFLGEPAMGAFQELLKERPSGK